MSSSQFLNPPISSTVLNASYSSAPSSVPTASNTLPIYFTSQLPGMTTYSTIVPSVSSFTNLPAASQKLYVASTYISPTVTQRLITMSISPSTTALTGSSGSGNISLPAPNPAWGTIISSPPGEIVGAVNSTTGSPGIALLISSTTLGVYANNSLSTVGIPVGATGSISLITYWTS